MGELQPIFPAIPLQGHWDMNPESTHTIQDVVTTTPRIFIHKLVKKPSRNDFAVSTIVFCQDPPIGGLFTLQNAGCIAALKQADKLLDGVDDPKATLRIIIDNLLYPITVEILHKVSHKLSFDLFVKVMSPVDLFAQNVLIFRVPSLTFDL